MFFETEWALTWPLGLSEQLCPTNHPGANRKNRYNRTRGLHRQPLQQAESDRRQETSGEVKTQQETAGNKTSQAS
jgi:hypothetical protein